MKLSDICFVYSGYAFKKFNDKSNGSKVIKIGNILNDGTVDTSNCDYSDETVNEKYISKKGDILVALSGATTGKVGVINEDGLLINQRVGIVRLKDNSIPFSFIYFYLKNKTNQILNDALGAAQPNISPKDISNYEINLPDPNLISKISALLETISISLANKSQQIDLIDELIKSSFNSLFSCDSYDRKKIGEISSICRGASPRPINDYLTTDPNGVSWIKIGDVGENDIFVDHTKEKITEAGSLKSRIVNPGDFILSNSMSFGRPYLSKIRGCVHDGWLIISDYQKYLDPMFFYYELKSDEVQLQFEGSANGSTVRNLNSDLVKEVEIIIPPLDKQLKFVEFANSCYELKTRAESDICKLNDILFSKINQYFGV